MYGNDLIKARRARRFAVLAPLRKKGAHVDYPYRYWGHKQHLMASAERRDYRRAA